MDPRRIEALERATVAAVSPQALAELPGWVLPFDAGTVARAKSAFPLSHVAPPPSVLPQIEAQYASRGLPVMLRIPTLPAFEPFRALLQERGYREQVVTDVCIAKAADVQAVSGDSRAVLADAPDAAWASVFLGEGFDPVDGASRVQKLGQAAGSLFATVTQDGRPVAAGAAAFSHGWASIHGMRTAQRRRREGIGARVMAALAEIAHQRSLPRIFLQVEADNAPAIALYRRAGFVTAWEYAYWSRQA